MARALQCPDCGWREPLDNIAGVAEFRCGGCGRALKVPPSLRTDPESDDAAAVDRGGAGADSVVPSPAPLAASVAVAPEPTAVHAAVAPAADVAAESAPRLLARASAADDLSATPAGGAGAASAGVGPAGARTRAEREAIAAAAADRALPWFARLAVWCVMLPFGLGLTYALAFKLNWLTDSQLIKTFGDVTWARFTPIARLLPVAALIVALLVHFTILLIEAALGRRRARAALASATGSVTGRAG